jgi:hypothetical protein
MRPLGRDWFGLAKSVASVAIPCQVTQYLRQFYLLPRQHASSFSIFYLLTTAAALAYYSPAVVVPQDTGLKEHFLQAFAANSEHLSHRATSCLGDFKGTRAAFARLANGSLGYVALSLKKEG